MKSPWGGPFHVVVIADSSDGGTAKALVLALFISHPLAMELNQESSPSARMVVWIQH